MIKAGSQPGRNNDGRRRKRWRAGGRARAVKNAQLRIEANGRHRQNRTEAAGGWPDQDRETSLHRTQIAHQFVSVSFVFVTRNLAAAALGEFDDN